MENRYKIKPRLKKRWFRIPVIVYDLVTTTIMRINYGVYYQHMYSEQEYEKILHTFKSKEEADLYKLFLEQSI